MCGRFSLTIVGAELAKRFDAEVSIDLQPNYNASPGQLLPIIMNDEPHKIVTARWGLVPSWSKEPKIGYKMINAMAETVATKPSYRGPFKHKRCLVLADSFFEWKKVGDTKTPYRIMRKDEACFAFAGLWDEWKDEQGNSLRTFTIITAEPNELVKSIHDRMPVILAKNAEQDWLTVESTRAQEFLHAYPASEMKSYPISTLVNSPKNNNPQVIIKV